jgi:hypothetical protein
LKFPREDSVFSLPPSSSVPSVAPEETIDDSWCGMHVDHSLLTVLCPAMFLFHPITEDGIKLRVDPLIIPSPSKSTGLYIKTRAGKTIKATIPYVFALAPAACLRDHNGCDAPPLLRRPNCLALQTGETLELLSSNRLAATPHFVNSTSKSLGRSALEAIEKKKEEDARWAKVESGVVSRETMAVFLQPNVDEVVSSEGETFGEFSARVGERHY